MKTGDTYRCETDGRRGRVRAAQAGGFDYVEVDCAQTTLSVYFLGSAPAWDDARFLRLEGGRRVRDIRILGIAIERANQDGVDDCMRVTVDRPGDFSTYKLCAVALDDHGKPTGRPHPDFDPRYASVTFGFKAGCANDLDCVAAPVCDVVAPNEPEIDYLAKDYSSFRRLLLDRLALTLPDWRERHVPDLGITLVELLAYIGDELSYYQDAVATEAYLDTARLRTSVRRHVRLVDYILGEGCNARAWVVFDVSLPTVELDCSDFSIVTQIPQMDAPMLRAEALSKAEPASFLVFEPLLPTPSITLRSVRNCITFYDWQQAPYCLPRGSTSATLADPGKLPEPLPETLTGPDAIECHPDRPPSDLAAGIAAGRWHELQLSSGDVLVFEEVMGPRTGISLDADPAHRHAVRLTRATPSWDPLMRQLLYEIEWCAEDALPFALCLSSFSDAPDCRLLTAVSVVRGNVVLADHGARQSDGLGVVPERHSSESCATECAAAEITYLPGRFAPRLPRPDISFAEALPPFPGSHDTGCAGRGPIAATALIRQDVSAAVPQVTLTSTPAQRLGAPLPASRQWTPRPDLLGSGPNDFHFTVEIDDDRRAALRFGDGQCGRAPEAGEVFAAAYRTGNGSAGNIGAETLTQIVFHNSYPEGVVIRVRNPMAARGGTAREPVAEAKLRAPYAHRNRLERAIIPADYADIVMRDFPTFVQRAAAVMRATGSRITVEVAIDTFGRNDPDSALIACVTTHLERYRRIGHDVRVVRAARVPLDIELTICVSPGYLRGDVEAAARIALGAVNLANGKRGFFHPDNLSFGDAITVSGLVAIVQPLDGVASVVVDRLERLFEGPNDEIANGILVPGPLEIVQLDSDPNFPENGRLKLSLRGGR